MSNSSIEITFDTEEAENEYKKTVKDGDFWVHVFESEEGYLSFDVVNDGCVVGNGHF